MMEQMDWKEGRECCKLDPLKKKNNMYITKEIQLSRVYEYDKEMGKGMEAWECHSLRQVVRHPAWISNKQPTQQTTHKINKHLK